MDFAIIAAGEGSRLRTEGIQSSKPMVMLQGIPLIQRLITIFLCNRASQIVIIINEHSKDVESYLNTLALPVPLNIIKKNTPGSLHSFCEILPHINGTRLCLTTVDTIFNEDEFSRYIQAFQSSSVDALMAVTDFVDDESPLYVRTNNAMKIVGYEDELSDAPYVSGGIYCLAGTAFALVQKAMHTGLQRMRSFQRLLVTEGLDIEAYRFSTIIDIDHVNDIRLAEEWLSESRVSNNANPA